MKYYVVMNKQGQYLSDETVLWVSRSSRALVYDLKYEAQIVATILGGTVKELRKSR